MGWCRIAALTSRLTLQFPVEELVSKKFHQVLPGNLGPNYRVARDERQGTRLCISSRTSAFPPFVQPPSAAAVGGTAAGGRMAKGGRVSLPRTAILNRSRPRAKCERTAPTEISILCAASL